MSQNCIFSGSTENLNTTMVITIDDQKYKVAISDECEDQAYPTAIKKIVAEKANERNQKLEQLKKIAEELGFGLIDPKANSQDLIVPERTPTTEQPQPQPPQPQPQPPQPQQTLENAPKIGSFRVQKNTREKTANNVGLGPEEAKAALEVANRFSKGRPVHSPTARQAPRFNSHQIPNQIQARDNYGNQVQVERPVNISKKVQVVKGRCGIPTVVPKNIISSDGQTIIETTINVVDTGGDKMLQNCYKIKEWLVIIQRYADSAEALEQ